jgi:hypothetical protein
MVLITESRLGSSEATSTSKLSIITKIVYIEVSHIHSPAQNSIHVHYLTLSDLIVAVDHFLILFVFKKNTMKNFLKEEKIKKVKRCRNFQ